MKMKNRYYIALSVVLLLFAGDLSAQTRWRRVRVVERDTVPALEASYLEALRMRKASLDSLLARKDSLYTDFEPDGKYYRLFAPLTFYQGVSSKWLGLDSVSGQSEEERALMDLYLRRPDLVRSTQRQLDRVGPVLTPSKKTPPPRTSIAERVDARVEDAPDTPFDIMVRKPNFWTFSGDYTLQAFQNYISSNWYKGGESSYSMLGTITLQANYNNKQKFKWDNKLEMRLGFQNSRSDTLHTFKTSEDLLRYTGKLGIQASKRWYYTFQLIATTQFMKGYKSNDPKVYSDFLAPLTLTPSVGMDYSVNAWKGRLTGSVHVAPLAYSFKFVQHRAMATSYGIKEGRHTSDDFGSELTADLTWKITDDIQWKTRLYGYTSYKRSLIEWENTLSFRVNKYISSNVFVYPRFDDASVRDDHHGYWMFKEFISLGFAYSM